MTDKATSELKLRFNADAWAKARLAVGGTRADIERGAAELKAAAKRTRHIFELANKLQKQ